MLYVKSMNWSLKLWPLWASVGCILGTASARGVVANSNPTERYQSIIERNAFGLKPPPLPPPPAPPPANPAASEIVLTGFASIVKPTKVYLMRKEAGKKDPTYYDLAKDQSKDGIEVKQIDEKARTAKILFNGSEMLLTFATHGIKPPAGTPLPPPPVAGAAPAPAIVPPPGTPPMIQPQHQPVMNKYGGVTAPNPYNPAGSALHSIPSRTLRAPQDNYLVPGQPAIGLSAPGQVSVGGNLAAQPNPAVPAQPQNSLNREEQYLLMKANEMIAEQRFQQGLGPQFPPMPPAPGEINIPGVTAPAAGVAPGRK